jgi:hypothetical protein
VLFEDAILFLQVRDHLKLPAIHPSREDDEKNPPSDRVEHSPSLPATAALAISERLNYRIVRAQRESARESAPGPPAEGREVQFQQGFHQSAVPAQRHQHEA